MSGRLPKRVGPAAAFAADEVVLDAEVLESIAAVLDTAVMKSLVSEYVRQAEAAQHAITAAAEDGDVVAMGAVAHDLKAISGTFGLAALRSLAEAIERACREGRGEEAARLADGLDGRRRQAETQLRRSYPMLLPAGE